MKCDLKTHQMKKTLVCATPIRLSPHTVFLWFVAWAKARLQLDSKPGVVCVLYIVSIEGF
jgi:hypothetical protein